MERFWVGGPCIEDGADVWLIIDGRDMPGMRPASKPFGFQEKWPSEASATLYAMDLNKEHVL